MKRRYLSLTKLLLLTAFMVATAEAWAAACCGGGFALPALIAGEDRTQITGSYSNAEIHADVGANGLWHARDDREVTESWRFEGATLLSDRWQAGGSLPLIKRTRQGDTQSGLGDASVNVGYEFLPDWDYNPWRPKGLSYLQLTLPTGRAIYETEDDFQLGARGRGFWALGLGSLFVKTIEDWDMVASFEAHRSFGRHFSSSQSSGELHPGWGGSFSAGGGYNLESWRFGGLLQWNYEDPISVTGTSGGTSSMAGAPQRFATAVLSLSYLINKDLATTLSYSDQTWFGSPSNTTLSRSGMIVLQKRWRR